MVSMPPRLRKIMVSATMEKDPVRLGSIDLKSPFELSVLGENDRFTVPEGLIEMGISVEEAEKLLAVQYLLTRMEGIVLIFANSLNNVHRLTRFLQLAGYSALEFSRNLSQPQRMTLINLLKKNKIQILVATDSIARGLDFPNVEHIINYDMPVNARIYLHRAGRTARANKTGKVYSLITPITRKTFKNVLHKIDNHQIQYIDPDRFEFKQLKENQEYLLNQLGEILQKEVNGELDILDAIKL
eukprot:TRINITY_DN3216_c2_g2_i1.p1 TRINITY_DN3216_c2_g2~~TRINITY_DN3216_c2_g2_i1.p1  ORF type:complete len:243 (+),score=64.17 TRINITY_DN3216_c2_g2_i1:136-864(+)